MDEEQFSSCFALDLPVIVVITKLDQCKKEEITKIIDEIQNVINRINNNNNKINRTCQLMSENENFSVLLPNLFTEMKIIPIFSLSSLTGEGIDLFTKCLANLPKLKDWSLQERFHFEFSVDSVYKLSMENNNDQISIIGGTVISGEVKCGQRIIIGPLGINGKFQSAKIISIHIKRRTVKKAKAGQVASLALNINDEEGNSIIIHNELRRGLVVLDGDACTEPHVTRTFTARVQLDSNIESLHVGSQPMIYLPNIRQSVFVLGFTIINDNNNTDNNTGCEVELELQFCHSPEFVRPGSRCFISEAGIKAKGAISEVKGDVTVDEELMAKKRKSRRARRRSSEEEKPKSPNSADSDELDAELEKIPNFLDLSQRTNSSPRIHRASSR